MEEGVILKNDPHFHRGVRNLDTSTYTSSFFCCALTSLLGVNCISMCAQIQSWTVGAGPTPSPPLPTPAVAMATHYGNEELEPTRYIHVCTHYLQRLPRKWCDTGEGPQAVK